VGSAEPTVTSATPTTTPGTTTPGTTPGTTTPSTTTPGTTTSTTIAPTTTIPAPRTLVGLDRPAGNVAVFGDSTFADQTGDFQLFDLVRDGLLALGAVDVRNYAVPGQGIIDGLEVAEPGWHLLGSYLEARAGDPYLADLDLAIIAVGRVDVNRLGADMEIGELAVRMGDELAAVVERFESADAQVVIVPAFGVNDEMFDALQCAAAGRCEPQRSEAKFRALNAALIDIGLPVLFDRYSGTDLDDVPGTDAAWFTEFDPGGRWPDDGQHPNPSGEQLIADQVVYHLAAAFGADVVSG